MTCAMQYAIFLLLSCNVAGFKQGRRCVSQPTCFDMLLLERMSMKISKDIVATDSENILLKSRTFDKIRIKKYLHSCVLEKIIDFYENVFSYAWDNSTHHYINQELKYYLELLYMMERLRSCTYKSKKRCETLYQKAAQQSTLKKISEADMTPKEVAILQLQKLIYASKRLNDKRIQERAMDELKILHHYMSGRGFRKTNDSLKH